MVLLASHYLCLEWKYPVVAIFRLYLPSSLVHRTSPRMWILRSCHIDRALFLQCNDLLHPIHVALCWDIGRTTCYQAPTLVTCRMNSWRWFSSTRYCLPLWLKTKRLILIANPDVICLLPFLFLTSTCFKCHSWWVRFLLNEVKKGLKHPILIFLYPIMLWYLGHQLLWSACGDSMVI